MEKELRTKIEGKEMWLAMAEYLEKHYGWKKMKEMEVGTKPDVHCYVTVITDMPDKAVTKTVTEQVNIEEKKVDLDVE